MNLLLDSQAFVNIILFPELFPANARSAIEDGNNDVYLSLVSPLELQIKINLGKLSFGKPLRQTIEEEVEAGTFELLPITLAHIDELSRLPSHHRDPFDRLLIAQAVSEGLTIVTSDQHIRRYPVSCLWD